MNDDNQTVRDGLVVSLSYKVLDDKGELIASAEIDDPVFFLQGAGEVIPGLENALYDMKVGETKKFAVRPADAYGEIDPDAFEVMPLDAFPQDVEVEEGMDLELTDPETGEQFDAWVQEIHDDDNEVLVSLNHPLAGQTLNFEATIVALRPATQEELDHGHAHGDDDDEH